MSYKIGLTGGIGSGKSTVARAFSSLGVPVFSADKINHTLTQQGEIAYLEITKQFGPGILMPDGELDRSQLGDIIFNDKELKRRLEDILHPLIMQAMHQRADAVAYPYCILDIPLLIGTAEQQRVDRILVVDCQQNTRIRRIKKRNGWSDEKIATVMSIQAPDTSILAAANDVIDNNREIEEIDARVAILHQEYLALAREQSLDNQIKQKLYRRVNKP